MALSEVAIFENRSVFSPLDTPVRVTYHLRKRGAILLDFLADKGNKPSEPLSILAGALTKPDKGATGTQVVLGLSLRLLRFGALGA